MSFINEAMTDISVGTAGLVALLGYVVVFVGLILLMWVIQIVGKVMVSKSKTAAAAAPAQAPAAAPVQKNIPEAAGTAGEVMLHDVPDRDAAMLMAIVAHKMGKPLNTLRFKSIKEVK